MGSRSVQPLVSRADDSSAEACALGKYHAGLVDSMIEQACAILKMVSGVHVLP